MRKLGDLLWFTTLVFVAMIVGFFILHFADSHGPRATRSVATAIENAARG